MDTRIVPWLACAAIAAVLIWFAVWSGGGGGDPQSGATPAAQPAPAGQPASAAPVADQSSLVDMLRRTSTENDPKQCTNDLTHAFLVQRFGSSKGTLDRCRRANTPQAERSADSITVEGLTATGSSTIAVIRLAGGYSDGAVLTYRVVNQGGRWKLDRLSDIQIDRAAYDLRVKNELGAQGYLPSETTCAMAKFDQTVSDADIERSAILGDYSSISVGGLAASCLSRATLLRELGEGITASLHIHGLRGPVVNCVVDRMTHGVPTVRLRHVLAAGPRGAEGWARIAYEAAAACLGNGSGGSPSTSAA
jgi:hypothetical protein